jgi:hypothetical protein
LNLLTLIKSPLRIALNSTTPIKRRLPSHVPTRCRSDRNPGERPHRRRHASRSGSRRRRACGDRLPVAKRRSGFARFPARRRCGVAGVVSFAARTPAASHVAARLSVVQSEGGCADGTARPAVLALRALALVQVGQLAAAGAPELQAVRWSALLVPQPQKHRLRRLWSANFGPLNWARKMIGKHAEKPKNNQTTSVFAVPRTKKRQSALERAIKAPSSQSTQVGLTQSVKSKTASVASGNFLMI